MELRLHQGFGPRPRSTRRSPESDDGILKLNGRKFEFQSLPELYSHVERRWIIDPADYINPIMDCGDIYKTDPYAAYDRLTGKALVVFNGNYYWKDRRKRKTVINNHDDIMRAEGDICDEFGKIMVPYREIRRLQFDLTKPLRTKATEAAISIIADGFEDILEVVVPHNVPKLENVVDEVYLRDTTSRIRHAIRKVRDSAVTDFRDNVDNFDWHEFNMHVDRRGLIVVEMGMDTRIRFFYEHHLREDVRRLQDDQD